MSAVERLQAAITKLEGLSSWVDSPLTVHEGPEWYELRDESGVQVAPYMSGFAAELLAALHRTIDAQLSILRDEVGARGSVGACCRPAWKPADALADAILGES